MGRHEAEPRPLSAHAHIGEYHPFSDLSGLFVPGTGGHILNPGQVGLQNKVRLYGPLYENTRTELVTEIRRLGILVSAARGLCEGQDNCADNGGHNALADLLRYGGSTITPEGVQREGITLPGKTVRYSGMQFSSSRIGRPLDPRDDECLLEMTIKGPDDKEDSRSRVLPLSIRPRDEALEQEMESMWDQMETNPGILKRVQTLFLAGDSYVRLASENLQLAASVREALEVVTAVLRSGCEQFDADPAGIEELTGLQLVSGGKSSSY